MSERRVKNVSVEPTPTEFTLQTIDPFPGDIQAGAQTPARSPNFKVGRIAKTRRVVFDILRELRRRHAPQGSDPLWEACEASSRTQVIGER
jgi:hypothetical protein